MTPEEAKLALQFHAGSHPAVDDERWSRGFLGSLRPYRGQLLESNFHEVMSALLVLAPELSVGNTVERAVMSDILGIIHFGRAWGVYADGMLRRNGLISDRDVDRLDRWVHCMQDAVAFMLAGAPEDVAFEHYREYCAASATEGAG